MKIKLTFFICFIGVNVFGQTSNTVDSYKLNQDFGKIIQDLSNNYIYLNDKKTDFNCVKETYSKYISKVKTNQESVLFFEYLLNEFYDGHLLLNTKTKASFRLHSPVYVKLRNNSFCIENIWFSQLEKFGKNILNAEVLRFNGKDLNSAIDDFPVQCVNKQIPEVREWIANKIIAGRYNEARMLTLQLADDRRISLNLDEIEVRKDNKLFSVTKKNDIAIIRINNSLGNNNLIKRFDRALDQLTDTKGIILDLRNTISGGNTYVARAIMSRFIETELPYQKHISKEKYGNNPAISKRWVEYVMPRGKQYKKPVVVLVGRWTGSMGEGLAIGLDGMQRATIVGSEMGKLAGSIVNYSFNNRNYGYSITTDKILHVNGEARENFVPKHLVTQQSILNDDVLIKALNLIKGKENENFVTNVKSGNRIVSKLNK
ncbi:S41 family peptidase [uncultured Polaribacter sp.]|uniref:S41 family peptidase n=1 Tax=uncultured Polaribacter sp. TaxID=174711 RepID=UPI00262D9337|nr:S41 family peptidase [uncultured Polaribacter sp.]